MSSVSVRFIFSNFRRFFFITWLILVSFIVVIDLLASFIDYLNYGLKVPQILLAFLYNIPTITVFCMPFAALFSSAYLFGKMNNDGELLGFMTLGYSIFRLVIPQIIFSSVLCLTNFVLAETITITSINKRQDILEYIHTKDKPSFIVFKGTKSIFYADQYIESESQFLDITIILFDENQPFIQRVDANDGVWTGEGWLLTNVRILNTDNTTDAVHIPEMVWDGQPTLSEINLSVKGQYTANLIEAYQQIRLLRQNGMPYRSELLNFLRRFSGPFTVILYSLIPLVLTLRRGSGVLHSCMTHFAVACIYTIVNMIFAIWARNGIINAFQAATLPFIISVLTIFGIYLYRGSISVQVNISKKIKDRFLSQQ